MFKALGLDLILLSFIVTTALTSAANAADNAGLIKTSKGNVNIERNGASLPATIGTELFVSDTIVTGTDGSVGITLQDGTLLSAGPKSKLILNKFVFDATTGKGELDASIKRGTLAVVSGKLSKTSKDAVVYRTPTSILGVRGTEFIIEAGDEEK
ncbi:MAG TPA: hypothetical protein DCO68_05405 [Methylophilaceae bacterium]|nr:hypothetical protein [Methylophilaceae bacterium]HAJ71496.1 hypothetical protein [Methylophilaceae bacterium]